MRATVMKASQNVQFVFMDEKIIQFMSSSSNFALDRDDANCLIDTEDYRKNW